jgi:toxin ParE1/3/4
MLRRMAAAEMRETVAWYNTQRQGLGREFRMAVHAAIYGILEFPERWPLFHKTVRRAVVTRFPYFVFYVSEGGVIRIFRVVHARRDLGPIRDLLP